MATSRTTNDPSEGRVLDHRLDGPTVVRVLVGARLRRLREARGISREDAGYAIRASGSKISRLERGRTGFKQRDVVDLLTIFGVMDDAERQEVLELAEQANASSWWQSYSDVVPAWFEPYLGLEQSAGVIRSYEVQFVPGLLQTEQYARAVVPLGHPAEPDDKIDRRVALRMRRQEILRRSDPPKLWVVIDEAALRRPYGGAATMRGQLRHLIGLAELPCISIQVMPLANGGHAAAGGPITFMRFPEGDLPDVVYLEQLASAVYFDKRADTVHYGRVLNRLGIEAEQPDKTLAILRRILKET
jgi:transcriptional regulator with XRE-family HTH domain